jgi:hypothetical protein
MASPERDGGAARGFKADCSMPELANARAQKCRSNGRMKARATLTRRRFGQRGAGLQYLEIWSLMRVTGSPARGCEQLTSGARCRGSWGSSKGLGRPIHLLPLQTNQSPAPLRQASQIGTRPVQSPTPSNQSPCPSNRIVHLDLALKIIGAAKSSTVGATLHITAESSPYQSTESINNSTSSTKAMLPRLRKHCPESIYSK